MLAWILDTLSKACIVAVLAGGNASFASDVGNIWTNGQVIDLATYPFYTGSNFNIKWDPVTYSQPLVYEVQAYNLEREENIKLGETEETEFSVSLSRSGHYIFSVRACLNNDDPERKCSEYCVSSEHGFVNDIERGWWIYTYIQPPGPIIVK